MAVLRKGEYIDSGGQFILYPLEGTLSNRAHGDSCVPDIRAFMHDGPSENRFDIQFQPKNMCLNIPTFHEKKLLHNCQ